MNFSRCAILILASLCSALAQTAPVHVIASNGMRAVLLQLQPKCEQAVGHPLAIEFGATSGLTQKIEKGEPFDLAILASDAIDLLAKEGKLVAATEARLARTGVGAAVRTGSPKPDIRTPEAMKRTLLAAKSVTYAGDGASRPAVEAMFDRLGIAAQMKPKIILTQGSGPAMESVAAGRVTIVLTLISELLPVHGIDVVGPLPAEMQKYLGFAAAANARAGNPEAARGVIALLKGSVAAPVYAAKGMEPVR